jgi:hypothetical protein
MSWLWVCKQPERILIGIGQGFLSEKKALKTIGKQS